MKAICTKYHGPTNTRGSRISASATNVKGVSLAYDYELDEPDNHLKAATALKKKYKWKGKLICGGMKTGYCCVFTKSTPREKR